MATSQKVLRGSLFWGDFKKDTCLVGLNLEEGFSKMIYNTHTHTFIYTYIYTYHGIHI